MAVACRFIDLLKNRSERWIGWIGWMDGTVAVATYRAYRAYLAVKDSFPYRKESKGAVA